MCLIELNAKAWNESKNIDSDKFITIGKLTWPSKEAFDKALKELYDSIKAYKNYEEKK